MSLPPDTPHLRPVPSSEGALAHDAAPETWDGISKPSRRGGPPRFLTDVLVEKGYCEKERVDEAIEAARTAGSTPENPTILFAAFSDACPPSLSNFFSWA